MAPAFSTADGALWVFIEPSLSHEDRKIPGIALGDAKGPHYGLLAGYFAPLLAPLMSDARYRVNVEVKGEELVASFIGEETSLLAEIIGPKGGLVVVRVRDEAMLLLPADRSEIQTSVGGSPSAAFRVTAGDQPKITAPSADRLEVKTERRGAIAIDLACGRAAVVTPLRRGSTSTFLVAIGTAPRAQDPFFSVPLENVRLECARGQTSTISLGWPPR